MAWRRDDVVAYYDTMQRAYDLAWGTARHNAIHFGYFDRDHRGHRDALCNMNRIVAHKAAMEPGAWVLDAGCGVGGPAVWLALHRGARVVGVNLNRGQLARARALAEKEGVAHEVTFVRGDYASTAFRAASFDIVIGIESICYAERKRDFLVEAHRLLRPGGRLVVADGFAVGVRPLAPDGARDMERWTSGWAAPGLAHVEDFGRDLATIGFADVAFDDITSHVLPSSRRIWALSLASLPLSLVLARLGLRGPVELGASVASRYQYRTLKAGLWAYGIFCARKSG
jgi:tocopherol O-methyltransferase